jgi:hypothetical protein
LYCNLAGTVVIAEEIGSDLPADTESGIGSAVTVIPNHDPVGSLADRFSDAGYDLAVALNSDSKGLVI